MAFFIRFLKIYVLSFLPYTDSLLNLAYYPFHRVVEPMTLFLILCFCCTISVLNSVFDEADGSAEGGQREQGTGIRAARDITARGTVLLIRT